MPIVPVAPSTFIPEEDDAVNDPVGRWIEDVERTVFFSDAVFAMTLLVIDIRVPQIASGLVEQRLPENLLDLLPRLYGFAISFWIIAMYWLAHHRIFHYIKGYDRRLLIINLLFLMWIVLMPFSASLLGEYGSDQLALDIYLSHMVLTSLSLGLLWRYAVGNRKLIDPDIDPAVLRYNNARVLALPLVFMLSIGISLFSTAAAGYFVLMLFLIRPVTTWYARRFSG